MTLRHMIIFRAVCENGYNSTKAASALHITQPAVSPVSYTHLDVYKRQ